MTVDPLRYTSPPQPHWAWATALIVIPAILLLTGFFGLSVGSPVSMRVASFAPAAALAINAAGLGAAVLNGRRLALAIAGTGMVMSAAGMGLLWLIASRPA